MPTTASLVQTAPSLLLRDRKPELTELCAQLVAGIMQGLVQRAAGSPDALGKDVDRAGEAAPSGVLRALALTVHVRRRVHVEPKRPFEPGR
ncbi:MAG: hypothetical protein ACRDNE_04165 [Gaiellaceae bacterium]